MKTKTATVAVDVLEDAEIGTTYFKLEGTLGFRVTPGDPGVHTFANGDPGYPPTPPEAEAADFSGLKLTREIERGEMRLKLDGRGYERVTRTHEIVVAEGDAIPRWFIEAAFPEVLAEDGRYAEEALDEADFDYHPDA